MKLQRVVIAPGRWLPLRSAPRWRPSEILARYGLVVAWAAVFVIFSVLPQTSSTFPTVDNFATIFGSQAVIAILTLALVIPLTTGDYDLSVAFNLTLSAMVLAILNVEKHWPIVLAMAAALAVGAVVGTVNGAFILYFRIDSLIVTLGTGTFIAGTV